MIKSEARPPRISVCRFCLYSEQLTESTKPTSMAWLNTTNYLIRVVVRLRSLYKTLHTCFHSGTQTTKITDLFFYRNTGCIITLSTIFAFSLVSYLKPSMIFLFLSFLILLPFYIQYTWLLRHHTSYIVRTLTYLWYVNIHSVDNANQHCV